MSKPTHTFPVVVYTYDKGQSSWKPIVSATAIANLSLVQDPKDSSSFRVTASLADTGKKILDAPIYKEYRFQTDSSQPKFHKLKIDKYYGFNFVEESDAKMFERLMRMALIKAKSLPPSAHSSTTKGEKLTNSDKIKKAKKNDAHKQNNSQRVKSMMIETTPLDSPTSRSKPPTPIVSSKSTSSENHAADPLELLEKKYLKEPTKAHSSPNGLTSKTVVGNTSPMSLTKPNFMFTPIKLESNHKPEKPKPQSQAPPPSVQDNNELREKVIEEIFTTEHEYVNSLTVLREMYYLPLKYAHRLGVEIMTKEEFGKIFYGFDTIYQLNEKFLHDLEENKANNTISTTIGQLFKLYAPSMKLYIDYVNRYETALQTIQKLKESSDVFSRFLDENQQDPDSQRRNIQDFLIMPIQRIPRYVLLLGELLKRTEIGHRDYMNIKHALEEVEKIANYINEKKRMYENQEMVSKIQERFSPKDPPLLKENRSFILEAKLYITDPEFVPPKNPLKKKKNKEPSPEQLGLQECYFFLFTDICLWGVQQKQYLVQQNRIKLIDIISVDPVGNYKVDFYDIVEPWKGFAISTSAGQVGTFYTNNFELFDKVIQQLQEAIAKESELKVQELQRRRQVTPSTQINQT